MSSDQSFVDYMVDQIDEHGAVTYRKMFGEYAIYYRAKVIALICDNQFFLKPTEAGRAYLGEVIEAPPYSGAKMYYLIEDRLEDREWISGLIDVTYAELPEPKIKKPKNHSR